MVGFRRTNSNDQKYLGRNQTDEWKGLLQILVLVYYYLGDIGDPTMYKSVRLVVATYLFITTYSHASSFYYGQDYNARRVIEIVVRINLLPVVLGWTLNMPYMAYVFAPLASFWFLITFCVMRVRSDWNHSLRMLSIKIVVAASCSLTIQTLLTRTTYNIVTWMPQPLEQWASPLDIYTSLLGILLACVLHSDALQGASVKMPEYSYTTNTLSSSRFTQPVLTILSCIFSISYFYLWTHSSITTFNMIHPYAAALPILAYVQIRNCTGFVRAWHSTSLAWLGRIGLELYMLHYSVWLAADGKGVLLTGFFGTKPSATMVLGRWLNCVLLGVVFVLAAWRARGATRMLSEAVARGLTVITERGGRSYRDYESVEATDEDVNDEAEEADNCERGTIELVDRTEEVR